MAATHWDSYQLTAIANQQQTQKQLTGDIQGTKSESLDADKDRAATDHQALTDASVFHLRQVLIRDPDCARAHLRLAKSYLRQFEQLQKNSENSMSLDQIRDAVFASEFRSSQELRDWLDRAFGKKYRLLYQAHYHTVRALRLCPLLGRGYLNLSELCFLGGHHADAMGGYISQAIRCRPYDEGLLYEIGRQHWLLGQTELAFNVWQQIYHHTGLHQLRIAKSLTRLMSADVFIELFNPDWQTIRFVWQQYQDQHRDADCQIVIRHAVDQARRFETIHTRSEAAEHWLSLSVMQRKSRDPAGCLESLHAACRLSPNDYVIRRQLGKQLVRTQLYEQAQPHLRWCLARQPNDSQVRRELTEATKIRLTPTSTAFRTHLLQQ
jgi:tetratricopeptide (TPR) repeat protein